MSTALLSTFQTASNAGARVTDDGYIAGAPEAVVEVVASSASDDLHDKKEAYRLAGDRAGLLAALG